VKNDYLNRQQIPESAEEILSEEQVTAMLGVLPRALRRWRQELGLPYIKIGSRVVLYKKSDVYAWLERYRKAVRA
jgi:predicted DNA-binding transcriptional regulator AlpA